MSELKDPGNGNNDDDNRGDRCGDEHQYRRRRMSVSAQEIYRRRLCVLRDENDECDEQHRCNRNCGPRGTRSGSCQGDPTGGGLSRTCAFPLVSGACGLGCGLRRRMCNRSHAIALPGSRTGPTFAARSVWARHDAEGATACAPTRRVNTGLVMEIGSEVKPGPGSGNRGPQEIGGGHR